jgi:hypothetical protein
VETQRLPYHRVAVRRRAKHRSDHDFRDVLWLQEIIANRICRVNDRLSEDEVGTRLVAVSDNSESM